MVTSPETMPIAVSMQRPAWRDTFSALRLHNYRLYVVAQLITHTAAWMQRIAVDWLVLELTGSIALVGLTIALQFLPTLFLGAYAGVVADRFPKRAMLLICQGVGGVVNLVLALLAIFGAAELLLVYALVLLLGIAQVFDLPARSVFINEMVGPRHLQCDQCQCLDLPSGSADRAGRERHPDRCSGVGVGDWHLHDCGRDRHRVALGNAPRRAAGRASCTQLSRPDP